MIKFRKMLNFNSLDTIILSILFTVVWKLLLITRHRLCTDLVENLVTWAGSNFAHVYFHSHILHINYQAGVC